MTSRPAAITDLPDAPLGEGPLATQLRARGLSSFHGACAHVEALPYGRASSWASVLDEGRGTCNSKHALVVMLARELGLVGVELGLGLFELSGEGFPGVARVLEHAKLPCMLEAHCYVRYGDRRVDLTWPREQGVAPPRILHETTIDPRELPTIKIDHHRRALARWLDERHIALSLDEAWAIREACIAAMST